MSNLLIVEAINEQAGYAYLPASEAENVTETRDTVADFTAQHGAPETSETSAGRLHTWVVAGSRELSVLDAGDKRLAYLD